MSEKVAERLFSYASFHISSSYVIDLNFARNNRCRRREKDSTVSVAAVFTASIDSRLEWEKIKATKNEFLELSIIFFDK